MRREFTVAVRERDAVEVVRAAKAAGLPPVKYVDQIVEAWVADLRAARIEDAPAKKESHPRP